MSKNNYFKGWYFKCSSNDKTTAFIPAYHRSNKRETASLQIIMDDAVFNIPFGSLKYSEKPLCVNLEECVFSVEGIKLNIKNDNLPIIGELLFNCISPIRYIWTQCLFENGLLMLSVADVPLFRFHFTGIIGVVLIDREEYRIATYLGTKIGHIGDNRVTVSQGNYEITAKLIKKNSQPLYAPENGAMNRIIHESASCKAFSCKPA